MSESNRTRSRSLLVLISLFLLVTQSMLACTNREDGPSNPPPPGPGSTVGMVVVDPVPEGAAAPWTLIGPNQFSRQGAGAASVTDLPAGQYTLTWQDYPGWGPPIPAEETRDLVAGETETFIGIYRNLSAPAINEISGSKSQGSAVTVSGLGFGTHTLDVEWLGDRIEALPTGTQPGDWGPGWRVCTSSQGGEPEVSGARVHSGQRSIRCYKGSGSPPNSGFAYEHAPFREMYVTWWTYWNLLGQDGTCTDVGGQWKMWRINSSPASNIVTDNVNDWLGSGNGHLSTGRSQTITHLRCADPRQFECGTSIPCASWCYPNHDFGDRYNTSLPNDMYKWVRWEIYIKASSAEERRDGKFVYKMIIPGQGEYIVEDWSSDLCTHRSGVDHAGLEAWPEWTRMVWQNYLGNCGTISEWNIDDVYLQFGTQARVELGDSPDYQCCRQREIQPVTAWTDASISLTINRGSFSPGQLVYMYVVRDDGSVSSAMPVTLQ